MNKNNIKNNKTMNKEPKMGIALTKEICRVCLKEQDGAILMNTLLTKKNAEEVESLHGKIMSLTKEPCDECKAWMEKGVIAIGIDLEKTDDMDNPYRSGHFSVITEGAFRRLFHREVDKSKIFYLDHIEGLESGMFIAE